MVKNKRIPRYSNLSRETRSFSLILLSPLSLCGGKSTGKGRCEKKLQHRGPNYYINIILCTNNIHIIYTIMYRSDILIPILY